MFRIRFIYSFLFFNALVSAFLLLYDKPDEIQQSHLEIKSYGKKERGEEGEGDRGGGGGGYEVVQRVSISAVRPNLISVIDRIKLTKRPNQLDIRNKEERERERERERKEGAQIKACEKPLNRGKSSVVHESIERLTTPEEAGVRGTHTDFIERDYNI